MEQYKEPTSIRFLPHCSNCGAELPLKEMHYEELSFSQTTLGGNFIIPRSMIKPVVCPNCDTPFENIIIDFGWYHGDVDIQYHEMIKFIEYIDKYFSGYFGHKEQLIFNKFRKLYNKKE